MYRMILGGDLVKYWPIAHLMMFMLSADVSTVILLVEYRSTIGYISVNCRSSLGQLLVDTRPTSFNYLLYIGRLSV